MITEQDQLSGRATHPAPPPAPPARAQLFPPFAYLWLLTFVNLALIVLVWFTIRSSTTSPAQDNAAQANLTKEENVEIDLDALNPYGQAIAKMGLTKCAAAMNDLSAKLLQGKRVGVYRFPTVHQTFVSLSMEVDSGQGAIMYVSFNITQDTSNTCQIAYEAVSDWANSCDDVTKTVFQDFIKTRDLLKSMALLAHKDNNNRKLFTMPVKDGCVVIEKQVLTARPLDEFNISRVKQQ